MVKVPRQAITRMLWAMLIGMFAIAVPTPADAAPPAPAKKEPKTKPKPGEPTADDFLSGFGSDGSKGTDDLKNAVKGVKSTQQSTEELGPRANTTQKGDAAVKLKQVFINNKIMLAGQGCVGGPPAGGKVMALDAPDLPFKLQAFAVCARLESARGRSTPVTFKLLTPKGRMVAQSEEVLDFGSKQLVDIVVDYPELPLPVSGVYQYRMEVDGLVVTSVPILEVRAKAPPAEGAPAQN